MFVLGNFINAVATIIDIALNLYIWAFIISALLSWVNPDPYNPIVRFLHNITEPVLARVRRFLPLQFGGIDLTPMIVILGIIFLQNFLVPTLRQIAMALS